jgi:hypothetical protein
MRRLKGEPPAPTPLDEVLSMKSLDHSPWVKHRLKVLGIKGRYLTTWLPPVVDTRHVPAIKDS